MITNLRTVGVSLRPSTPHLADYFKELKAAFTAQGIEVLLDIASAEAISEGGVSFEQLCTRSDLLLSVGGDGTLISLARRSHRYDKPILGVNVGNLGFLTSIAKDELAGFLKNILNGDYCIEERMMLDVTIENGHKTDVFHAFNDIVITKNVFSKMLDVEVTTHGKPLNTYYGDGLIVCTPSGSSAYNLSAGGPVVHPLSDTIVLTPICPHALTQRSLALPASLPLELHTPDSQAIVFADGQESYTIEAGDTVLIKKSAIPAKLIQPTDLNYFTVLREKLHWGKSR